MELGGATNFSAFSKCKLLLDNITNLVHCLLFSLVKCIFYSTPIEKIISNKIMILIVSKEDSICIIYQLKSQITSHTMVTEHFAAIS